MSTNKTTRRSRKKLTPEEEYEVFEEMNRSHNVNILDRIKVDLKYKNLSKIIPPIKLNPTKFKSLDIDSSFVDNEKEKLKKREMITFDIPKKPNVEIETKMTPSEKLISSIFSS